jgi:bifunctional DNase/RNase
VFWSQYDRAAHFASSVSAPAEPLVGFGQFDIELFNVSDNYDQHVVFLREIAGVREFSWSVGTIEAWCIYHRFHGAKSRRPQCHDALLAMIDKLGGCVEAVSIDKRVADVYFASFYVRHKSLVLSVDVRPSDALLIALAANLPIQIANPLVEVSTINSN